MSFEYGITHLVLQIQKMHSDLVCNRNPLWAAQWTGEHDWRLTSYNVQEGIEQHVCSFRAYKGFSTFTLSKRKRQDVDRNASQGCEIADIVMHLNAHNV